MPKPLKALPLVCAFSLTATLFGCASPANNAPQVETKPAQQQSATTEAGEQRQASSAAPTTSTEPSTGEPAVLETTTFNVNGVDMKMILVEGGTFTMGSDSVRTAVAPHTETISQNYLMAETEVTEALWNAVMGQGGGSKALPKTSVTWPSTFDFLERLNQIAHEQGIIPDNANFFLPTEAEWEFAAIGGNQSQGYTYAGGNDIDAVAQTQENSGTHPVAVMGKLPNELGLYDMSGNAYEWVNQQEGSGYVKRGGSNYHSFASEPYLYTPQGRYVYNSTDWTIGFRIALR